MTKEGSYEDLIKREMNGFAAVPNNNATERSFKDRDRLDSKVRARKAVEERLKMKMSPSSGNLLPSSENTTSRFEELLKRKMSQSAPSESTIISRRIDSCEGRDQPTSPDKSHLHTVKETFERRMKKEMSEFDSVPLTKNIMKSPLPPVPHLPSIITVEKNSEHSVSMLGASLMIEMSDSDSSESESMNISSNDRDRLENNIIEPMKMSSSARDRLGGKIQAREAVEKRLNIKMSQSSGSLLPSTDNAASLMKRKMSASVPSESNIIFREPDLFEDHVNKKMSESAIVPTVNATPSIESQKMTKEGSYEERINRKIGGYAEVPFQEDGLGQSVIDTPTHVPLPFEVKEPQRRSLGKALKGKISKSLTLSSKGGKTSELRRLVLGDNTSTRHSAK
eukprot:CAMPEP_0201659242 /NCGR_PEP_ID=MMETSP0494-20130426/2074_1 /ASSEMBLY_ACC=CAM_ASM_000839 /TAXON_ID=420259 /ORGANISM="Thalassiosira gravida, Strain GMp14c1" /LENGTH=393 /DNA_ID=CAMNT_0048136657 /DNA_START=12 /DNA_END=1193 /DNA_ORIENTATION=+